MDVICQNRLQNTPKMFPEESDMISKKNSISDNQGYTKNTCAKFHD